MSMKLSEQLLLMAELTPSEAASAGMRIAAEEVVKLESENARLSARVAELEAKTQMLDAHVEHWVAKALLLESQLAWTPVSAGLPAEPGWYVFSSHEEACDDGPLLFRFKGMGWRLQCGIEDVDGARVEDPWTTESMHALKSYRRIELPEGL